MLLWIFRILTSLLLAFLIFAAFLLWLVISEVSADLESGDQSHLSLLVETMDQAKYAFGADLRREVELYRHGQNREMYRARTLLVAVVAIGTILMGLMHLPDLASSLRWPGYALLVAGLAVFVLGWLAQVILPEVIGRRVDAEITGTVTSASAGLLRGIGLPGLWLAVAGALLIIGSHILKFRTLR